MRHDLFLECDSCRGKPGAPELCHSCLHNRASIGLLHQLLVDVAKIAPPNDDDLAPIAARIAPGAIGIVGPFEARGLIEELKVIRSALREIGAFCG